jgi:peptidoglycan/xylan/chitin deacetylase (PgdA/CDA1 family)
MRRKHLTSIVVPVVLLAVIGAAIWIAIYKSTFDVISPREARDKAVETGQSASGAVDCSRAKCVALTFDGGPSAPTPKLLDILRQRGVHVTFFLQGKGHIDRYPATVRRMDADGHELANHTWTHADLTDVEPDQIRTELVRVQDTIAAITGRRPNLMRPPGGLTDRKIAKVSRSLGLAEVLWSVTAKDYATTNTKLIIQRVLSQTHPDGIILLHERYKGTIPAVPPILDALKRRGYTVVTVSELIAPAKPEPGMVYRP